MDMYVLSGLCLFKLICVWIFDLLYLVEFLIFFYCSINFEEQLDLIIVLFAESDVSCGIITCATSDRMIL